LRHKNFFPPSRFDFRKKKKNRERKENPWEENSYWIFTRLSCERIVKFCGVVKEKYKKVFSFRRKVNEEIREKFS
jgi:hypothetical protein